MGCQKLSPGECACEAGLVSKRWCSDSEHGPHEAVVAVNLGQDTCCLLLQITWAGWRIFQLCSRYRHREVNKHLRCIQRHLNLARFMRGLCSGPGP